MCLDEGFQTNVCLDETGPGPKGPPLGGVHGRSGHEVAPEPNFVRASGRSPETLNRKRKVLCSPKIRVWRFSFRFQVLRFSGFSRFLRFFFWVGSGFSSFSGFFGFRFSGNSVFFGFLGFQVFGFFKRSKRLSPHVAWT